MKTKIIVKTACLTGLIATALASSLYAAPISGSQSSATVLQNMGTTAASRPPRGLSSNCSRACTSIERLICTDRSLSILDREMAGLYDRASSLLPSDIAALLNTEQRSFLANRNLCSRRTSDKIACVQTAYEMQNLRLNEWVSNRSAD